MSDNLFPAPERFERKHDTSQGTVVGGGGGRNVCGAQAVLLESPEIRFPHVSCRTRLFPGPILISSYERETKG